MNKDCVVYGYQAPRPRSNLIEIAAQGAKKLHLLSRFTICFSHLHEKNKARINLRATYLRIITRTRPES